MPGGMNKTIGLGTWFGLKMSITPFSILCFLAVVPVVAVAAGWWGALSFSEALSVGALSSAVMFFSDWLHQRGHALAARRVGHPMIGIRYTSLFSASIYPADEPPLPPRIHIIRALGGFWVNVLIALILTPAAINLWPEGGVVAWVTSFAVVCNFFVIGLGALLPIDIPGVFTIDGGTIWRYLREEKRSELD